MISISVVALERMVILVHDRVKEKFATTFTTVFCVGENSLGLIKCMCTYKISVHGNCNQQELSVVTWIKFVSFVKSSIQRSSIAVDLKISEEIF